MSARLAKLLFNDSDDEDESLDSIPWEEEIKEHFDTLDDEEFARRFRLAKQTVLLVLEKIEHKLDAPTELNHGVSAINQLLCALRYYATGCYITAGANFYIGISTAQSIVQTVSVAIAVLRPHYMHFPESADEIRQTQKDFYKIARFPIVIGAIGCTHMKYIKSPGGPTYLNKKNYYSLNIQAISNAKLEFIDIVARWPGRAENSQIFNNCQRKLAFEKGQYGNAVLVGDAQYACTRYMMTPLEKCKTGAEILYNECHLETWNSVRKLFELWKRRFPSIAIGLGDTVHHSLPIIIATTVLHNIAVKSDEGTPPNDNQVIDPASWDDILAQGFI